ncbi:MULTISPECIES: ABC transporter substrate-binding protein [unclassified Brevibacterium]|uniref:ABC transporter substrate-binding protein n=1 Tax=unclassified Brevibacterium TaxID=2614124 RepID=UPI00143D1AF1|nr:ABC transporter substrate-binding protein [Brevibacterium sp. S22]
MKKSVGVFVSVLAAGSLALGGCGGGSSSADESGESETITVPTGQGEVEVPKDVKRIVAINGAAADTAAALGRKPVAVAGMVATGSDGLYPWEQDLLGDVADDSLVDGQSFEVNVENVAELEPDVILAAPWNVTDESVYKQLSAVAPVVTPDSDAANPDWDDTAKAVGTALGKDKEVDELIEKTKRDLESTGDELGVTGKTYQLISPQKGEIFFGNAKPLELYGLKPGKHQTADEVNNVALSTEKMNELDADYLFIWPLDDDGKKLIEDNPAYKDLPAVQNDSAMFIDENFAAAINAASPASLEWLNTQSGIEDILKK